MGNFLAALNLDYLTEDEDVIKGILMHVVKNGKPVTGYSGLPYFNLHFGATQFVARVARDGESGGLVFSGFDTHADTPCAWKLRIVDKIHAEEDDPARVKLLLKGMDGKGFLPVDVVNGDILPSFKEDEVVELQMVAFAENAEFYDDEEAYAATVPAGHNGKKLMIAENTVFPLGVFSDDDDVKDVVQIHGVVKKTVLGATRFDDEVIGAVLRCYVDTQFGEIVVITPATDAEKYESGYYREGKVIDCFAKLSGDAAIYGREEGVIHDAENNLRLVAYTLEGGDPERLRSALADHFVYHSENAGVRFENVDEYMEFIRRVHDSPEVAHTVYASITEIEEGPVLEYPVGTRCAVIRYESEEGYNSIIFVDTDGEGKISRIYLSKESRYKFSVDRPFPEEESLSDLIAGTTWQFSVIGRSHFHRLISDDVNEEQLEEYISAHQEDLENDLADLFGGDISEEAFSAAFLRGVRKSGMTDYDEEDIVNIGKQFHKDATLFRPEEEQKEIFRDALILVSAIGRHYIGPVENPEEKESARKKKEFEILTALKKGYETGDFEDVGSFLTDESVFASQWVREHLTGEKDIMEYLRGKGETLKKHNAFAFGDFIICPDGPVLRLAQDGDDTGGIIVTLDEAGMAARIDLCDLRPLLDESDSE